MTTTTPEEQVPSTEPVAATTPESVADTVTATATVPAAEPTPKPARGATVQPVLEKLFELYPHLFGAEFLPLKLGIFQELLAAHPEQFQRDTLKLALGMHTRSARYLQSVAAGKQRHDLQGAPVEDVSPQHNYLALLELFRRRQSRARVDLRPTFRVQLIEAFQASGLSRQDYQSTVQTNDEDATLLLEEAFAEYDQWRAKQEALVRAFEGSGKTEAEFADMYGMNLKLVSSVLARVRAEEAAKNKLSTDVSA